MIRYILLLLIIPSIIHAEVLTLKEAIAIGLQNSFDIKSEQMVEKIREESINISESKFDPVFAASVNAGAYDTPTSYAPYNMDYINEKRFNGSATLTKLHQTGFTGEFALKTSRTDTNNPYEELDPSYKTVFLMNITVPLMKNFGKDINSVDLAKSKLALKQAKLQLYNKMIAKTASIETAYRNVTKTKEVLKLAVQASDLAKSLLESDKQRFNAGIAPITEVQEAETAVAAREEQVILAQSNVDAALNNLDNLLNMDGNLQNVDTEPLTNNWINFDINDAYMTALKIRPDIATMTVELQKYDLTIKYLKNQELPELDIVNTLGVIGYSGDEKVRNNFNGTYPDSVYDVADTDGFEVFVGLNFKYPLGGKSAKAKTASASSEKRRAAYNLKKSERDAKKEIKDAAIVIESGKKRYDISQTSINLAEITLSQEMKKLKEGLSDTFRILKFQNDVIDAKMRSINALYDYNLGLAMLYKADGTNLDRYGFKLENN